jgi:hypothetical protein
MINVKFWLCDKMIAKSVTAAVKPPFIKPQSAARMTLHMLLYSVYWRSRFFVAGRGNYVKY